MDAKVNKDGEMEESRTPVLIIDDDPTMADFMGAILEERYDVAIANHPKQGYELLEKSRPEVLFLDVFMPDENGFQVCKKIRASGNYHDLVIIFVTGDDSEETFLNCYEAGGDDFILKPFNVQEIIQKAKVKLANKKKIQMLRKDAEMATGIAMSALTNQSDYGKILHFFERSMKCQTIREVASLLLSVLDAWGVKACVRMQIKDQVEELSWDAQARDVEFKLLRQCHGKGSIIHLNHRLVSDSEYVSVYVPNMPDDDEVCGRLRDNIRVLVNGANSRAVSLELQSQMTGIAEQMKNRLLDFEAKFKMHSKDAIANVDLLHYKTEVAFTDLHLTEEQEDFFTGILEESKKKLIELTLDGTNLDVEMENILEEIKKLATSTH